MRHESGGCIVPLASGEPGAWLRENLSLRFWLAGTKDEAKKQRYRQKISEYMTRAEDIKKYIEKEKQGVQAPLSCSHLNV